MRCDRLAALRTTDTCDRPAALRPNRRVATDQMRCEQPAALRPTHFCERYIYATDALRCDRRAAIRPIEYRERCAALRPTRFCDHHVLRPTRWAATAQRRCDRHTCATDALIAPLRLRPNRCDATDILRPTHATNRPRSETPHYYPRCCLKQQRLSALPTIALLIRSDTSM